MPWSALALSVQIAGFVAVSLAVILIIGVLGGQWALRRQIIEARDEAELANTRINREIKTRAGREGVEARQEAKSLTLQATEALAAAGAPGGPPSKPSTVSMINGGRR